MAWRRCRGAACALMGPVDRPAALNQGVDGANDRLDAHPARNCTRSVVAGPCRAPRHGVPIPGRAGRSPTPFGRRLVCHAPPRTQEGRPPRHPSKHKRLAGSFEHAHFPNEQGVAPRKKKLSPTRRVVACVRSSLLYRRPAPRSRCVYHRLHPPARNGATRDLLRVCLRCRHQRSEPRKSGPRRSGPHLQWLWTWHRPIRTCAA